MFNYRKKCYDADVDYDSIMANADYSDFYNLRLFKDFRFFCGNYEFPTCFYKMYFYLSFGSKNIGYYDFLMPNGKGRIIAHDFDKIGKSHNLSMSKIETMKIYSDHIRCDKSNNIFDVFAYDMACKYSLFGNFRIDVSRIFINRSVGKLDIPCNSHHDYLISVHYVNPDYSDVSITNRFNYDFDGLSVRNMYFYFNGSDNRSRKIDFKDFLIYILSNGIFEYFQNVKVLQFFASYPKAKKKEFFMELKKSFDLIDKFRIGEYAYESAMKMSEVGNPVWDYNAFLNLQY